MAKIKTKKDVKPLLKPKFKDVQKKSFTGTGKNLFSKSKMGDEISKKFGFKKGNDFVVKKKKHKFGDGSLESEFADKDSFMKSLEASGVDISADLSDTKPVKWYENNYDDNTLTSFENVNVIYQLKNQARLYLETDATQNESKSKSKNGNEEWIKTMISKGTAADKVAAYTLLIQDNPLHNLKHLNTMISLVKVSKKRECFLVLDTLVELFLTDLLPPNRKLISFNLRPLLEIEDMPDKRKRLMYWFFEDQLKQCYQSFIQAISQAAQDTVSRNKEKAVSAITKLLVENSEQESTLLAILVNKLGDPDSKVGSKVIYCLGKLINVHPNMRTVVMEEIEKLLFRPNIRKRAQYYGTCFLSQLFFTKEDSDLAGRLIKIYFAMFKACVKQGDIDSKMMKALLTGVHRAYPYVQGKVDLTEHINTVYKIIHLGKFNVGVHALCLLFQVSGNEGSVSDRFYNILYKKINDTALATTSSHHAMFLSLVFKALKKDTQLTRVKVFIKRLLQVCVHLPVPIVCGILLLISQVVFQRKEIIDLTMNLEPDVFIKFDEDKEEVYYDVKEEETEDSPEVKPVQESPVSPEPTASTWYRVLDPKATTTSNVKRYEPFHRNPLYAGGDNACYTELTRLLQHFHPTVALFAANLLNGVVIKYSGDPLQDFTMVRFLDRFVFKNPKKPKPDDEDAPSATSIFSRKQRYTSSGLKSLPIQSEQYLNADMKNIPIEEMFLYRYFQNKKILHDFKPKEEDDSDNESVKSDDFDKYLNQYMTGDGKDELDFAKEIGQLKMTDNKKSKAKSNDESGSELDEDVEEEDKFDDLSDFSEVEDFGDDDDYDSAEMDGSDLDDEVASKLKTKSKKNKSDMSNLLTSAEKFSELIESASKYSGVYNTKDNADVKQIKWEIDRNRWLNKGGQKRKNFNSDKSKGGSNKKKKK